MALSEVAIVNQANGWNGAKLITSFDDESVEAELAKANYSMIRDAVLEEADWSFAIKRYKLVPSLDIPASGYTNAFTVPSEVIRVITVTDKQNRDFPQIGDWVLEGDRILCNYAQVYIRALRVVTDPSKYPPAFVQALAARYAMDTAMALTQSRSQMDAMAVLYQKKLSLAKASDGRQGRSQKTTSNFVMNRRYTGGSVPGGR